MDNERINGGAIIFARQTIESEIFADKPAIWFKIWFYLISKARHENRGKFNRGQCFLTYQWIKDATGATQDQVKHCVEYLKSATMIATHKSTRGMIITIIKYDYFQTLDNYYTSKSHIKSHTEATQKPQDKQELKNYKKNTPEQSSETIKKMKKNTFGSYKESDNSDSYEEVLDSETGESRVKKDPKVLPVYQKLITWSVDRRGFPFVNIPKQYKAFKTARLANITPDRLQERWLEFENDKFYKDIGFDWANVVSSFDKKS